MKKVIVFGGAFNPPTKGHESVIREAADKFDEVWVIPSINHAFAKRMLDVDIRVYLLGKLLIDLNLSNVKILNCESAVAEDTVVYTIDLLRYLAKTYPDNQFKFLCGEDNQTNLHKFKEYEAILEEFGVYSVNDVTNIRSTYVRESIVLKNNDWRKMVTPSVESAMDLLINDYGAFTCSTDITKINSHKFLNSLA